jgi:hypothetical protein
VEKAREKMNYDHESKESIPLLPLGFHDLQAIENILSGNIGYLRNMTPLASQTVTRIQMLEDIRARIQLLRFGGDGKTTMVSEGDILVIREAMLTFVQVTRRLVPQSPERDETLKRVGLLRKHLEKIILR